MDKHVNQHKHLNIVYGLENVHQGLLKLQTSLYQRQNAFITNHN